MFRRLLGLIILVVSLILVSILLGGAFFVGQAVDAVGEGLDNGLTLTADTLAAVSMTLEQTKATISEANNALDTASEATLNLSKTMDDMGPLMESTTTVVTEDVPGNIEAVQAAIPNITEVASVIDVALTKLSNFGIKQTIPIPFNPIELEFDLGIDYEPEEPFDESISALGDSLEGMPEELRSLRGDLETLSGDLELLSGNIETAASDIEAINEQVTLFIPILDEYLRIVDQIDGSLGQARAQMLAQLETLKTALIILLVFLTLTQIAPLYIGWELISGQRPGQESEKEAVEAPPPPEPEEEPLPQESEDIAEKAVVAEYQESDGPPVDDESDDIKSETIVELPPEAEAADEATAETIVEGSQEIEQPTVVEKPPVTQESESDESQA